MLLLSSWSVPGFAQEEADAATTAAARALAIDGVKLAEAGDCEGAVEKLHKAQQLYHSPVVASRLGECEIELGRLVEGTERLRKLLREPVPENASAAVHRAFARAKTVLDQATPKLAAINITVIGPARDEVVVTVNGRSVPSAALGVEFPADPGRQVVEVSAPGYYPAQEQVSLAPGQSSTISVSLKAEPRPAADLSEPWPAEKPTRTKKKATPSEPEPTRQPARVEDTASPSRAPAYVSLAVGVVGLGVGAGFGLAAKGDYDALAPECPSGKCPLGSADALDAARRKGTIATVGLGVGAAGIVLGTIFLLTGSSSDAATPEQALGLPAGVRTWVGINEVGFATQF